MSGDACVKASNFIGERFSLACHVFVPGCLI
jgi:hypothetical protein